MSFTIERRTGRLVEARVFRLATAADVEAYSHAFTPGLLAGHPSLLADHRPVTIYPQEVAAKLVEMFQGLNRHWERVAIVVAPSNATLSLQLMRVVRESRNPSRRMFTDPHEACEFLGATLQPLERARAEAFLDHAPASVRGRAP